MDHYGTFSVTDYEAWNDKFVNALNKSCEKLADLDFGYSDNLGEWNVRYNIDESYRALKGYKRCQSFMTANIVSQKETIYQWKRYSKVIEMIQKETVGKTVGTRMGRLVGYPAFAGATDPYLSQRLLLAQEHGITRDEIGIWRTTGLYSKLDGRYYDLDDAHSFIRDIKKRLDLIRKPTLTKRMVL